MKTLLASFLLLVPYALIAQETSSKPFVRCNQIQVRVSANQTDTETLNEIAYLLADHNFEIVKYVPEIGYIKGRYKNIVEYIFKATNGMVTIYGNGFEGESLHLYEIERTNFVYSNKEFELMDKFAHLIGTDMEYKRVKNFPVIPVN